MDADSDDEVPAPKRSTAGLKRKVAALVISSEEEGSTPPKKKLAVAAKPSKTNQTAAKTKTSLAKPARKIAKDDALSESASADEAPMKKAGSIAKAVAVKAKKQAKVSELSSEVDAPPPKKKPKAPVTTKKKALLTESSASSTEEEAPAKKPKPKAADKPKPVAKATIKKDGEEEKPKKFKHVVVILSTFTLLLFVLTVGPQQKRRNLPVLQHTDPKMYQNQLHWTVCLAWLLFSPAS